MNKRKVYGFGQRISTDDYQLPPRRQLTSKLMTEAVCKGISARLNALTWAMRRQNVAV